MPVETPPRAEALLKKSRKNWEWVVRERPFCEEEHVHTGGASHADPVEFLRLRVALCAKGDDVLIRALEG